MTLICKVQRHLVVAYKDGDSGEFVFVVCRRGLEQALNRRLKVGEKVKIKVKIEVD